MENVKDLIYSSFWILFYIAAVTLSITQLGKASTLNELTSLQIEAKASSATNGVDRESYNITSATLISDIRMIEEYTYPYVIDGLTLTTSDWSKIMDGDVNVLSRYVFHRSYAKYIHLDSSGAIIRIEYKHL